MRVVVMDRIQKRHPELSVEDVLTAFRSVMVDAERGGGTWMAIGLDGRGRNVEMIYRVRGDEALVYHAFTPPTKKFMKEIQRRSMR